MKCQRCGSDISDDSRFCEVCGEAVHCRDSSDKKQLQPMNSADCEYVNDYMTFSIVVTLIFHKLFGVIAMFYSSKANKYLGAGDINRAMDASNKAKIWCICSLVFGMVIRVVSAVYLVILFLLVYGKLF